MNFTIIINFMSNSHFHFKFSMFQGFSFMCFLGHELILSFNSVTYGGYAWQSSYKIDTTDLSPSRK